MASIDTGGIGGGRKKIDSEIPLVPFIDLLLCCVMFLLVSAVWNATEVMETSMPGPTPDGEEPPPLEERGVGLHVTADGYVITTPDGSHLDVAEASAIEQLRNTRRVVGQQASLLITADDGVAYDRVIHAMDYARGSGFEAISVSDRAFTR